MASYCHIVPLRPVIQYQGVPVVIYKAKRKQHTHPANATTGVLFTATIAVKFPITVTQSSWALLLSYYRAITFLLCRISKSM